MLLLFHAIQCLSIRSIFLCPRGKLDDLHSFKQLVDLGNLCCETCNHFRDQFMHCMHTWKTATYSYGTVLCDHILWAIMHTMHDISPDPWILGVANCCLEGLRCPIDDAYVFNQALTHAVMLKTLQGCGLNAGALRTWSIRVHGWRNRWSFLPCCFLDPRKCLGHQPLKPRHCEFLFGSLLP